MKKGLMMALILCMAFSLISCGSSQTEPVAKVPESDEFDSVLVSGDGYHLVLKRVDEFSGAYDMIGTVDDDGNWIHPLSEDHVFIIDGNAGGVSTSDVVVHNLDGSEASTGVKNGARIQQVKTLMSYLGEGMFALEYSPRGEYMMYNAEKNIGFDAGKCSGVGEFHDGYLIVRAESKVSAPVKIISSEGEIIDPGIQTEGGEIGNYSEGVFFVNGGFYDINGALIIDLSEYEIVNVPMFEDNKCYLEMENNEGTIYTAELDHNGAFLSDPQKK